jgi:hypothetical protein
LRNSNAKWREYLDGSYTIENSLNRNQMDYNIRQKAKQMMEDLLLICERMPHEDLVRVFRDPKMSKVVEQLAWKIKENTNLLSTKMKNFYEVRDLARGLELFRMKYDLVKLCDDEIYRNHMKVWLYTDNERARRMRMLHRADKRRPIKPIN